MVTHDLGVEDALLDGLDRVVLVHVKHLLRFRPLVGLHFPGVTLGLVGVLDLGVFELARGGRAPDYLLEFDEEVVLVVDVQLADSHRALEEVSRFSALQLVAVIVVQVEADGALQVEPGLHPSALR